MIYTIYIINNMPGYVIHLAVAKEYMKNNIIENESEFLKGVISPDILKTSYSHYGTKESNLDMDKFMEDIDLKSSYGQGYYLHMITDNIFYYEFLPDLTRDVYFDYYDSLNEYLIKKYNILLPIEIKGTIQFKEGISKFANKEFICEFIDKLSKINLKQYFEDEFNKYSKK